MKRILIILFLTLIISAGKIYSQGKVWSLEECIIYAIDHNIQIKQQGIRTEMQKNSLDLSKLSLLPTINGQASHNYTFGRALDQQRYEFYNRTLQSDNIYLGGSAPVFDGLRNYNTIQQNKYLVLASEEDLKNISDNIALNVALGYLQILLNKELVIANESQLNTTLEQIERTRKQVEAGSIAKGNLLQIEAQAAQEELALINMKNQLETSYLNLTQFLELQTPAGFEVVAPEITVDTNTIISGNIDDIYGTAVLSRPEVKSSELSLAASQYGLKIAKGGRSPRLSLNYSVNSGYTYIYDLPEPLTNDPFSTQIKNNRNSGVGLTMAIPILNGWQVNKNISNSKLSVENNQYALDAAKKQLYKNIQQAYTDATAAMKKLNVSIKAIASTEESFRYTESKFNLGMVTPVDYNVAKTQLLKAQSDNAQAKYEFIFKTKVLDFYKGLPLTLN